MGNIDKYMINILVILSIMCLFLGCAKPPDTIVAAMPTPTPVDSPSCDYGGISERLTDAYNQGYKDGYNQANEDLVKDKHSNNGKNPKKED